MKGAIYDETGLGLYYYGTRWYDSLLGRWIQPDSIVPLVSQGVQAWDRFAYVNNSPVRYSDPSGHDRDCSMWDSACKKRVAKENGNGKSGDREDNLSKLTRPKKKEPDGKLYSFNVSIGVGPWFIAAGWDVVETNADIGVFSVLSVGPGLGRDTAAVVSREKEDRTFLTPQAGFSVTSGNVYGEELQSDVRKYQGTALFGGASLLTVTGERIVSVDPITGLVDNRIKADVVGGTYGLAPMEGHVYYARAVHDQTTSKWMRWLKDVLDS